MNGFGQPEQTKARLYEFAPIDNAALLAAADTFEDANTKLVDMMTCLGDALDWLQSHNSQFELDKTALVGFSWQRAIDPNHHHRTIPLPQLSIDIGGHIIGPKALHRFLGVILDQGLWFKEQATEALIKGTDCMGHAVSSSSQALRWHSCCLCMPTVPCCCGPMDVVHSRHLVHPSTSRSSGQADGFGRRQRLAHPTFHLLSI
jgi:hypothetical protein